MDVITAGELLEQRQCSPQCLLALKDEAEGCSCRCGGKYHGSLLDAELTAPPKPWWQQVNPWALDITKVVPIARTQRQANALYRSTSKAGGSPFYVQKAPDKHWRVEHDCYHFGRSEWGELESRLLNRFMRALLEARRADGGTCFPAVYTVIYNIPDLEEACVIYTILAECLVGNVSTVVRAIEVLEGRPDPVELGYDAEKGYPDRLAFDQQQHPNQ